MENSLFFEIHQVAKMYGITVRTLQYYDQIGLLCPKRRDNRYRSYSLEDLSVLENLLLLRAANVSLADIRRFFSESDMEERKQILIHCRDQMMEKIKEEERNLRSMEQRISKLDELSTMPMNTLVVCKRTMKCREHSTARQKKMGDVLLIIPSSEEFCDTESEFHIETGEYLGTYHVIGMKEESAMTAQMYFQYNNDSFKQKIEYFAQEVRKAGWIPVSNAFSSNYGWIGNESLYHMECLVIPETAARD